MSNLHRLQWIDAMVRAGRYPNCRTIADKFELSIRQASRDIEYLRDSLGAPLAYSAQDNGYYYTEEPFVLPARILSEEEQNALAYLAQQYAAVGGNLAERLAQLFGQLAGQGAQMASRAAAALPLHTPHPHEVVAYEPLRLAIEQQRQVELVYVNYQGQRTQRTYCPYKLFSKEGAAYVVGYCELRQDLRVLKLARIRQIVLTSNSFEIVPFYNAAVYGAAQPFHFVDPYSATIHFARAPDPQALKLRIEPQGDDPLTYRVAFYRSEELIAALLAQTQDFVILRPAWLRERLRERLERLYHSHQG